MGASGRARGAERPAGVRFLTEAQVPDRYSRRWDAWEEPTGPIRPGSWRSFVNASEGVTEARRDSINKPRGRTGGRTASTVWGVEGAWEQEDCGRRPQPNAAARAKGDLYESEPQHRRDSYEPERNWQLLDRLAK